VEWKTKAITRRFFQGNAEYFLYYIRQYLLLFGAESFVFQFAIQKYKHQGVQNRNFTSCLG
jgi:hypothetical protein